MNSGEKYFAMFVFKIMKINITILGMLLFLGKVQGQDSLQLSLQQAIKTGLSHNKNIQASALESALTGYKIKEYKAGLYPTVTGNVGIIHYFDVPVQYAPANTFDPTAPANKYVGLKLLLPNAAITGISANWTLYDQAIYSALKLAKETGRLTDIQIEKDRSDLAFSISQLYYGIVFAKKQQASLLKVDSNTAKLVDILQAQADNGVIKKSDVDKVKVNKVNIESRIDQLSAVVQTQINLLKVLLSLPEDTRIKLTEPEVAQLLVPLPETSDAQNNFDLRLLEEQISIEKLERKTILGGYYPSVSANYNYSYNWVSADLSKTFGSNLRFPQQYLGLNVAIPIFDGNRKLYQTRQNEVTTRELELKSAYLLDKTRSDIVNAILIYNTSLRNMGANDSNVKLGEESYNENLYEYQQGTASLNDVITTENTLQQALNEYFGSVSNAFESLLEYKRATNTILTQK